MIDQPEFQTIAEKEIVFTQNQPVEHIYHLVHGQVSLWVDGQCRAKLSSGHILGLEGAYSQLGTYPVTAQAEQECRLAVLSAHAVPEILLDSTRLAEMTLFSLSRQLEQRWRQPQGSEPELGPHFVGQVQTVAPGTEVIREGESTDEVYRIVSTTRGLEVSREGSVLAVLDRAGDFFGEMAAVLQEPRTATVRSVDQSVLEVYPASLLPSLVTDYPDLGLRLIQGLSQRLKATNLLVSKNA